MKFYPCLAAIAALLSIPAQAEDCSKLVSYGTIPLTQIEGYTQEFVPVEIAGVPKLMMLDSGAYYSVITKAAADELHLEPLEASAPMIDLTGAKSWRYVTTTMKIDGLPGSFKLDFWLSSAGLSDLGDKRIVGLLGANVLTAFDVSADFGANTLTLINPKHCEGGVVYWPQRPLAVIPFDLKETSEIVFSVTLDGHEVKAQIDTGASNTTLLKDIAVGMFGITPGSPDTPVASDLNGAKDLTTWTHRFKTLSLGGVVVSNPDILIIPDKMTAGVDMYSTGSMLDRQYQSEDVPPMLIGMDVLRHVHLYIAYREHKLYITPASEPATQPAAQTAPSAPAKN